MIFDYDTDIGMQKSTYNYASIFVCDSYLDVMLFLASHHILNVL